MEADRGGIDFVVDPELGTNYPRDLFISLVDLALKCSNFKRDTRPTMKVNICIPFECLLRRQM